MYYFISVIPCSHQDKHYNSTLRGETEEEISLSSNKKFMNMTHSFKSHTSKFTKFVFQAKYISVFLIFNRFKQNYIKRFNVCKIS